MTERLLTIIIPTYRTGRYFHECINSICNQTFNKEKFEILVILNGEKEPYYQLINSVMETFSSLHFTLIYTEVKGVSIARNIGLRYVKTPFILFIDDDDIISDRFVERCMNKASNSEVVVSKFLTFTSSINETGEDYVTRAYNRLKGREMTGNLYCKRGFLSSVCGKILHVNMIGTRAFNTNLTIGEDALFMFLISDQIRDLILADEGAIYYRRIRAGSATRKPKKFREVLKISLDKITMFSTVYFKTPQAYSFKLYLTRILASIKVLTKSL